MPAYYLLTTAQISRDYIEFKVKRVKSFGILLVSVSLSRGSLSTLNQSDLSNTSYFLD